MKFKNTSKVSLSFEFHGMKHVVAPDGEWECPARLAYAVTARGLPLEPVGSVERAIDAEQPMTSTSGAMFLETLVNFQNTSGKPLSFEFHGKPQHVAPGATWQCPERIAYAIVERGLPLKRVAAEPPAEPTKTEKSDSFDERAAGRKAKGATAEPPAEPTKTEK